MVVGCGSSGAKLACWVGDDRGGSAGCGCDAAQPLPAVCSRLVEEDQAREDVDPVRLHLHHHRDRLCSRRKLLGQLERVACGCIELLAILVLTCAGSLRSKHSRMQRDQQFGELLSCRPGNRRKAASNDGGGEGRNLLGGGVVGFRTELHHHRHVRWSVCDGRVRGDEPAPVAEEPRLERNRHRSVFVRLHHCRTTRSKRSLRHRFYRLGAPPATCPDPPPQVHRQQGENGGSPE
mmetsp:Transcript_8959/g.20510  ORF Transcript_8959/g.20510 Transcript_8959/m.20510 type:complete len:235 (+) Transcript_8959:684-1388(+)